MFLDTFIHLNVYDTTLHYDRIRAKNSASNKRPPVLKCVRPPVQRTRNGCPVSQSLMKRRDVLVCTDRADGIDVPVNPPHGNLLSPRADKFSPPEGEIYQFAHAYSLHTH